MYLINIYLQKKGASDLQPNYIVKIEEIFMAGTFESLSVPFNQPIHVVSLEEIIYHE